MHLNAYSLIIWSGVVLTLIGIAKPQWPLVGVAVLLVCIALLTKT